MLKAVAKMISTRPSKRREEVPRAETSQDRALVERMYDHVIVCTSLETKVADMEEDHTNQQFSK